MYHDDDDMMNQVEEDSPWMDDEPYHAPVASSSSSSASAHARKVDQVAEQEWEKLSVRYSDAGYRDGITAGKQSRLQAGFDQGFNLASPAARQLGTLRGVAATLLAVLTTNAGAKHAGGLLSALEQDKEALVAELRAVVSALGKLDERKVLPVDLEAEEHAKSHAAEAGGGGESQAMLDKREMDEMGDLLSGLGNGKKEVENKGGLEECQDRLELVLARCGMQGVLPAKRG